MTLPRWTGQGYEHPQKWACKKDMPAHLRREGKRVNFGLFGYAWIALDANSAALMKNGNRLPTFTLYLTTPGAVIGPRDNQAASNQAWAFEWQQASSAMMLELCDMHCAVGGAH